MKITAKKIICFILCLVLSVSTVTCGFTALAASNKTQLQNDINKLQQQSKELEKEIANLKAKQADQQAIVNALHKKIANTQAQIARCNREIESINSKIAANKAEIDKKNKEIDANKLDFKKRIRAIYMSNSDSSVKVLLGADDFADFLQLSQLTAAVSSRDKAMIEDIVAAIEEINAKNAENEKLLQSQVSIRESIAAQQKQLQAEDAEATRILNGMKSDTQQAINDNAEVEAEIKAKQNELKKIINADSGKTIINPNTGFVYPTQSRFWINSPFGTRWGRNHNGIDITGSGIYGTPIYAVSSGVVYIVYSSCTHRSKSPMCSCGGGYGNYVAIDHGLMTIGGKQSHYKAYYAHMDSVAVSNGQSVSKGQIIGYVGTTGRSTGYHLHFGLMKNNSWVDPAPYVR